MTLTDAAPCARQKFQDPLVTAGGEERAHVSFAGLDMLWINTGTLCNVECAHCYIESSPTNDRLEYLTREELSPFLEEIRRLNAREVGFTGGEPFMNPDMIAMTRDALKADFTVLILTNAMKPMMRPAVRDGLSRLIAEFGDRLSLRVSLDHYTAARHDAERGAHAFESSVYGLKWLASAGAAISIAGRSLWDEKEDDARRGFQMLFDRLALPLDASRPDHLIIFPEMDSREDVPEITTACWDILEKNPNSLMCATARMLVKRKGAAAPTVLACTLIPYDDAFELGPTIAATMKPVSLNHPHCAKFCVIGGASCSGS